MRNIENLLKSISIASEIVSEIKVLINALEDHRKRDFFGLIHSDTTHPRDHMVLESVLEKKFILIHEEIEATLSNAIEQRLMDSLEILKKLNHGN